MRLRRDPARRPQTPFMLMLKLGLITVIVLSLLSMCSAFGSHLIEHAPRSIAAPVEQS